MGFGDRLKQVRGVLRQDEFAAKAGFHKNTIGRWERDEQTPNVDDLNRILQAYPDINPSWLLTGEGGMKRGEDVIILDGKELTKVALYPIDLKRLEIVMLGVDAVREDKTFQHYEIFHGQLRHVLIYLAYNYFITEIEIDIDTVTRFVKAYLMLFSLHKGKIKDNNNAPRIELLMETFRKMEEKENLLDKGNDDVKPDKGKKLKKGGEDQAP